MLRLFVTVEAVQFRSLVHPIPLQRLRIHLCTQAAPSEPRNRPRLGKPGITTSCALNLTSLPRPCTFPNQLRGPKPHSRASNHHPKSATSRGSWWPGGTSDLSGHLAVSVGTPPPEIFENFPLSYDSNRLVRALSKFDSQNLGDHQEVKSGGE